MSREPILTADGKSVIVSKKVYDELIEDQKIFIALQNAGVDNWEGWADVMADLQEGE